MNRQEIIVLAHRYLYYVESSPVISDMEYDRMEREVLKRCSEDSSLHEPGSDLKESYSEEVIRLAKELQGKG